MEKLMQILTEACPGVEFDGQTALIDDGILGSLDIVTIVSEIMEEFDETAVPRDFWDLTGYALAFMASNSISAGDSKANTAMALYQKLAGNMMFNDAQNDGKTSMMDGEHEWRV